jgi:hypothetical protein
MELNTKVNGTCKLDLDMAVVIKFGAMEVFMRGIGKMIKLTEEEDSFMQMVIFMTASGRTIKLMALENTLILMVPSMKDTGSMISNTVKVKRSGQMVLSMREIISLEKRTDSENFYGLIDLHMKVTF